MSRAQSGRREAPGWNGALRLAGDGHHVAFGSREPALTGAPADECAILRRDRWTAALDRVDAGGGRGHQPWNDGHCPDMSDEGARVLYPGRDSNHGHPRLVALRDAATNMSRILDVRADGTPGTGECRNLPISGDGRIVIFESVDVSLAGDKRTPVWGVFRWSEDGGLTCVTASLRGADDIKPWTCLDTSMRTATDCCCAREAGPCYPATRRVISISASVGNPHSASTQSVGTDGPIAESAGRQSAQTEAGSRSNRSRRSSTSSTRIANSPTSGT